MEDIRRYLISVTAAAIICGIITGIIGKNGAYGAIVKVLCGLFLVFTLISPWSGFELTEFTDLSDNLQNEADSIVSAASRQTNASIASIIKAETEAYILDKAESVGSDIQVDIQLSTDDLPTPNAVTIKGTVSPYAKQILQQYIADELDIPKESQLWI